MINDLRQFVPSSVCLKCDGCCRFKEADSRWRPFIAPSEMKRAAAPSPPEKIFGPHVVGPDSRINTSPCAEGLICHFFNHRDGTCGIYHGRPFECQLYPFLLVRSGDRAVLCVHLNCPFAREHVHGVPYQEYVDYLRGFFARPDVLKFLQENPRLFAELSLEDEDAEEVFDIPLG